ncbi:curli-like amyloid fiber formation chaperone CsgH [Jannaschia seohaensis]|uniref:Uncharacterized protein n=1 Tax=Jannaschia seohaensis TaxID=475081 RepID=A0A2Y9B144_9RHOB|nr:curli-like amyloid fiber formation chaperone CsgH [Jannaschia seohaensis]PWJ14466.1 hypothetical protein BCF38_11289 [Jannaschia seohaensis]SSA50214.1 hypothetical protein SAMN05421539_11289 [Jannaschia seohaensis]
MRAWIGCLAAGALASPALAAGDPPLLLIELAAADGSVTVVARVVGEPGSVLSGHLLLERVAGGNRMSSAQSSEVEISASGSARIAQVSLNLGQPARLDATLTPTGTDGPLATATYSLVIPAP